MSLIKATVVKVKALRAAGAKLRRRTCPRACLCCGATFQSEGPHNRLCERCRRQSASPFDTPATVGRR